MDASDVPESFLPWLCAWVWNFLPDQEGKHETKALAGTEHQVLLASHNVDSNILIKIDKS